MWKYIVSVIEKLIFMKKIIAFILISNVCGACYSQQNFDDFIKKFKSVSLPLEDILNSTEKDTLNGKQTNDIIVRSQEKKPEYLDKDGNLKVIKQYYGLYPEEPFAYGYKGKKMNFYSKIIPIGRLNLNKSYVSLIIKVVDYETTFYDLWNFTKDGKVVSVVCLFWGMRDAGPRNEKVTFTIVSSKITKDGIIVWHENNDGLETFRTYKLNNDGYFQVIKEQQKGKSEF
jgi:hypothetical protein